MKRIATPFNMVVSLRVIVDICVGAIMLRQQLMELVQVGQQR